MDDAPAAEESPAVLPESDDAGWVPAAAAAAADGGDAFAGGVAEEPARASGDPFGIPSWEMHYLVAAFLEQGPCTQSAALLKRELAQHGMLPARGHLGTNAPMSFEDVGARHGRAFAAHGNPGAHLPALLDRLFDREHPDASARFETHRTLIGTGRHALVGAAKPAAAVEAGGGGPQPPRRVRRSKQRGLLGWLNAYQTAGQRRPTPARRGFLKQQYSTLYTVLGHYQAVFSAEFDTTGRRMITASDDKLVKIWDTLNGQLLHSLRGHTGEIIMIDVNPANTIIASCDNRGWVRLWRLRDGAPLAVLRAHAAANTEQPEEEPEGEQPEEEKPFSILHVAFMLHAGIEYIVCTTADGQCPIWSVDSAVSQDAQTGLATAERSECCTQYEVVRVGDRTNYAAQQESPRRGAAATLGGDDAAAAAHADRSPSTKCLDINPQQTHVAAGCSDNNIYIYDVFPSPSAAAAKTRHRSRRVGTLSGHTKPVDGIKFAHTQTDEIGRILSSSEDETVRIWGVTQHAGIVRHHSLGCIDLRPPVVRPVGPAGGGRNRGRGNAAPARKSDVSCIIWSLDDTRVVTSSKQTMANPNANSRGTVAEPDKNILQVWSAERKPGSRQGNFSSSVGELLFTLGGQEEGRSHDGHLAEEEVYVLKEHPYDCRLMLSGGYDGRAFVWNIVTGDPILQIMNTPGTKIIEGSFSRDGTHVVIADTQGYFSVFGSGPPPACLKEQFFVRDYDQLTYDHAGWCEDATTQQPPHTLPRQLADSEMSAFPDALQPSAAHVSALLIYQAPACSTNLTIFYCCTDWLRFPPAVLAFTAAAEAGCWRCDRMRPVA